MAKQRKDKLYCDVMAEQNGRMIHILGKIVNAEELHKAIADDFVNQAITQGIPLNQVGAAVARQLERTEIQLQMAGLTALNNWFWGGRQVYRFDEDLAKLLYSQTKNDIEIDSEALELLPCPHFYISLEDEIRKGFFVSYYDNILYISDMGNDFTLPYGIRIPRGGALISEIIEEANYDIGNVVTKKQVLQLSSKISCHLQFIIYLSAMNAEIEPVTKGSIVTRQAGQRTYATREKTEISNVGYKLGTALRESQNKAKIKYIGEHSQGSPKSPHIRRSHFHSFWTGSGEDKKLIVKWVNTIFVHGDTNDNDISTVHNIE